MKALEALAAAITRATSLENPATPLSSGSVMASIGDVDTWEPGAIGNPLQIGTALRCVQILSSTVAGCPLRVTDRETAEDVKIPALAMERQGTTPFELWETVVAHLALWGNAYVRKIRARDGRILHLVPIHPARVRVDVEDATDIGLAYVKKFTVDGKIPLTERDIMHIPGLSIDGVMGLSVIGNLRRTFRLAASAERTAERMFDKGLLNNGFLTSPNTITEEQAKILRARWAAKLTGIDNAYEIGILDQGATFEQLSMNPVDAQFLESRKFETSEIARIFGVPGWVINDQEKATSWGTGMEQQFIAFVIVTLKGYFQRIEQRVAREICDPVAEKAEFKVEGLLRGDTKARAAFYASGIQHGWLVPNDVRPLEDLPDVPWGDEPYRPYNQAAGDQTDPAADPQPKGEPDDDEA